MEKNVVITAANIDEYIEQWHEDKETDLEMHEYLGLSFEQFGYYVSSGELLVTGSLERKPCPNCQQVMIRQVLFSGDKEQNEAFKCTQCDFLVVVTSIIVPAPTERINFNVTI